MKSFGATALSLAAIIVVVPAGAYAQGRGQQKVAVCHMPPGNPANAHTLTLPEPAVRAHLAHGDTLGACGATGTQGANRTDSDRNNAQQGDGRDNQSASPGRG